jgi:hypothetical protein
MKDPNRLLRGDASPLERLLLDASARERPPMELVARTRSALGLPPTPPPLTVRDALSSWGPKVLLALAGAALVGTLVRHHQPAPVVSVGSAPAAAPAPVVTETPKQAGSPAAEAPTLSVDALPLAPPEHAAPSSPTTTSADSLREEIAQIDKVRAAMRQGAPARALSELDTYRARFPRGVLQQESVVLRVQALMTSGQTAQAQSLGQSFLAHHPNSPHAEKIARILGTSTNGSR